MQNFIGIGVFPVALFAYFIRDYTHVADNAQYLLFYMLDKLSALNRKTCRVNVPRHELSHNANYDLCNSV